MKKNKKIIISISAVIICVLAIVLITSMSRKTELTQLSDHGISQMMGYIIKTNNNKIIAIDGGTPEDTENWLKNIEQKGNKVDVWFITHPHRDHASVFQEVVEKHSEVEISKVYYTANPLEWYTKNEPIRANEITNFYNAINLVNIKDKVEEVNLNQKIKIDNVNCEILGIKNPEITVNPINNSSMVIKMNINGKKILFLGDTGVESGNKLLENQKDKLKADIVQMAHHGQSGVNKDVYEVIRPEICLWPTPEWLWNNDRGEGFNTAQYKTVETRTWMNELKPKRNIIEKDGDITIEI